MLGGTRKPTVAVELFLIGFYKDWISPLLPRACRFVPTCSSYGMQAYEQHGAAKGFVLTAWRIVRCNPFGGSGFDPPRWPPPALGAGSSSWWRETPLWRDGDAPRVAARSDSGPGSDGSGPKAGDGPLGDGNEV
ncbi:hemolytic domain-containing protein [Pavlovales sp. CCMP2436]|nr:hemolytic domain-containing protein [Pavlovales sp. CCMP2436]